MRRQVCVKNVESLSLHPKSMQQRKLLITQREWKPSSQLSSITRDLRVDTSRMHMMTMGTFTCSSHMLIHQRTYNEEKPYMCNVWTTSLCTSESVLGRSHMNVQSVVWPLFLTYTLMHYTTYTVTEQGKRSSLVIDYMPPHRRHLRSIYFSFIKEGPYCLKLVSWKAT